MLWYAYKSLRIHGGASVHTIRIPGVTSSSLVAGSMIAIYRIFPRAATRQEPTTIPFRNVNTSSCMFTQVQT